MPLDRKINPCVRFFAFLFCIFLIFEVQMKIMAANTDHILLSSLLSMHVLSVKEHNFEEPISHYEKLCALRAHTKYLSIKEELF